MQGKYLKYLKHIIYGSMFCILLIFTFIRYLKLLDQEVIRTHYELDYGARLPSFTICFYFFNQEKTNLGANVSFSNFMENAYDMNKFISYAVLVEDTNSK